MELLPAGLFFCVYFHGALWEAIYRMSSDILRMERRELRKAFPHLKEWRNKSLWAPSCFQWIGRAWMGGCGEIYTKSGEVECENAMYMPWT